MKPLLILIGLLFSLNTIAFAQDQIYVTVKPHYMDDSFDDASKLKLKEAVQKLEQVFNSEKFAQLVAAEKFKVGHFNMSAADIYDLIKSGKNNYQGSVADSVIDLKLKLYDKFKGGSEFGRTMMSSRITETHRCYVLENSVDCYVVHLAHEYMHQIGFSDIRSLRALFKKTSSVPYKIGDIVRDCLGTTDHCEAKKSTCKKEGS